MKKNTTTYLPTLGTILCVMLLGGCFLRPESQQQEPSAPLLLADTGHGAEITTMIDNGRTAFLLQREDSRLYPVEVVAGEFIETFPIQIRVRLFSEERVAAVPVAQLFLPEERLPVCSVELKQEQGWQPAADIFWSQGRYLRQTDDGGQLIPAGNIRIFCDDTPKKEGAKK